MPIQEELKRRTRELHQLALDLADSINDDDIKTDLIALDDFIMMIKNQASPNRKENTLYYNLKVADKSPNTITTIKTTYLDTTTMKMATNNTFLINDLASSNYNTVWVFCTESSGGSTVRCFTTAEVGFGATPYMHFHHNPIENWWTIKFQGGVTQKDINLIYVEQNNTTGSYALYTNVERNGKKVDVYLLPADAIKQGDKSGHIVAVESTGKYDLYVWQMDRVQVTCADPIK